MGTARSASQSAQEVYQMAAGIASLFDPKILTDMTSKLKGLADRIAPEHTATEARKDMTAEERGRNSLKELSKLKILFAQNQG